VVKREHLVPGSVDALGVWPPTPRSSLARNRSDCRRGMPRSTSRGVLHERRRLPTVRQNLAVTAIEVEPRLDCHTDLPQFGEANRTPVHYDVGNN
jgi:hypothetical protein